MIENQCFNTYHDPAVPALGTVILPTFLIHICFTTWLLLRLLKATNQSYIKFGIVYLMVWAIFHLIIGAVVYKGKDTIRNESIEMLKKVNFFQPWSEQNAMFDSRSINYYRFLSTKSNAKDSIQSFIDMKWKNSLIQMFFNLGFSVLLMISAGASICRLKYLGRHEDNAEDGVPLFFGSLMSSPG